MSEQTSFLSPPTTLDVRHEEKVEELKRELAMRAEVYPKLIDSGKLDQGEAARRVLILEAILEDYQMSVGVPPCARSP